MRILILAALLSLLAGCTSQKPNSDELREKTAEATAQVKSSAKAVAEGVKEGWNRDKPLDLNKATKDQLLHLPGITGERADRVIARRPYGNAHELVSRGVLSEPEYEKIKDQITAKN